MTGNLIPEYRTDKNGRSVLRHVRSENHSGANTALSAAAPALPKNASGVSTETTDSLMIEQIMDVVQSEISATISRSNDEKLLDRMRNQLSARYNTETLEAVHSAMQSHQPSRRTLSLLLKQAFDKATIHEAAVFLPEIWINDATSSLSAVMALHDYEGTFLPLSPNYAVANEDVKQKCVALVNVTAALLTCRDDMAEQPLTLRGPASVPVIDDSKLVGLIVENPDKAPLITNFIQERLSVDHGALIEMISSGSSQLAEGAL